MTLRKAGRTRRASQAAIRSVSPPVARERATKNISGRFVASETRQAMPNTAKAGRAHQSEARIPGYDSHG